MALIKAVLSSSVLVYCPVAYILVFIIYRSVSSNCQWQHILESNLVSCCLSPLIKWNRKEWNSKCHDYIPQYGFINLLFQEHVYVLNCRNPSSGNDHLRNNMKLSLINQVAKLTSVRKDFRYLKQECQPSSLTSDGRL